MPHRYVVDVINRKAFLFIALIPILILLILPTVRKDRFFRHLVLMFLDYINKLKL